MLNEFKDLLKVFLKKSSPVKIHVHIVIITINFPMKKKAAEAIPNKTAIIIPSEYLNL